MAHETPANPFLKSRVVGLIGMAAAASMTAAPGMAAELPQAPATGSSLALIGGFSSSTYNADGDISEWGRCGWRGCRRGWRGRRGVRGGDILAGAVILGGIAAIASAANNNNRRRDREVVVVERDRTVDRRDDRRFDDRRSNPRASSGSGIDNAVSQCLTEIERDVRVDNVDGASRVAQGWVVSGTLFNGSGFTCQIGNDGRISDIDYGGFSNSNYRGSAATGGAASGQWSDDRYANARASVNGDQRFASADGARERPAQPLVPLTADRLPAYPGGPVPGE